MRKTHRVIIPVLVLAVAIAGGAFSSMGLTEWYPALQKPALTPPDWVFGPVWAFIYVLGALSAVWFWDRYDMFQMRYWWINGIFRLNLLLNLFWSYIFFVEHQIGIAFIEINLLNLTTLALITLLWPIARRSALLLIPYFVWVSFATYLTYEILVLNP